MTPGTIVRFSPVLRALDPAGIPGTVIESTTRHRIHAAPERAILVAPLEGAAVWVELPCGGVSLQVTG